MDRTRVEFDLVGMTCAACAARIERGLNKLEGIKSINVNLALETAVVQYNTSQVSIEEIEEKVEKMGYKAILNQNGGINDHKEKEWTKQKGR